MATIARLDVLLSANTSRFDSRMKRSTRSLTLMQSSTEGLNKVLGIFGGLLLSGVVARGLKNSIAQQFQFLDSLGKTSDKLGIAVDELQSLRAAAALSGVEIRTFDLGLQRMTRRVAEAAQGTGEAKDAIAELGLDAVVLAGKSPDAVFRDIAAAMEQVENQGDRVRLGFKLFDSEGVALVNTLRIGKQGLLDIGDELDAMGASLSRVDVGRIEDANDAMKLLSLRTEAAKAQFAIALAPAVALVADELSRSADESGRLDSNMQSIVDRSIAGFATLADVLHTVNLTIDAAQIGVLELTRSVVDAVREFDRFGDDLIQQANDDFFGFLPESLQPAPRPEGGESPTFLDGFSADLDKNIDQRLDKLLKDFQGLTPSERITRDIGRRRAEIENLLGQGRARPGAGDDLPDAPPDLPDLAGLGGVETREELFTKFFEKLERDLERQFERGEEIARELQTPLENFQDRIREIEDLLEVGALNIGVARQAAGAALADLDEQTRGREPVFASPAALERVSAGAFSAEVRHQAASLGGDQPKNDPLLAEAKKQTALLTDIKGKPDAEKEVKEIPPR